MRLQVGVLPSGKLEEKVRWETAAIAADLFIESSRRHPVERCELGVEQHLLAAQDEDRACDALRRNGGNQILPVRCARHDVDLARLPTSVGDVSIERIPYAARSGDEVYVAT